MIYSNTKSILTVWVLFLFSISIHAQDLWKVVDTKNVPPTPNEIVPYLNNFNSYSVDFEKLTKKLSTAPSEFKSKRGLKVSFPMPDGTLQEMEVFKSKMLEDKLQAKFPEIQNYKLVSSETNMSGRIGISPLGFIGSISTPQGKITVERYGDKQTKYYISYYSKDVSRDLSSKKICGVTKNDKFLEEFDLENIGLDSDNIVTRAPEGEVTLRTYRFALACTGEWTEYKGVSSVDDAMALMNESVVLLNEIFEYEVGIRLILIDDNDKLLHLNPTTDPYDTGGDPGNLGGFLLGQNTVVIGTLIGLSSWDIGHVYHRPCNVGGIASLGSVCGPGKGNGVTCHYANIAYMAGVTAHEVGHQFSASHTFNHCDGENESTSSGFEPGSGHTIMSYGGLCGPELNVTNEGYNYFHGYSIEQITTFSQQGNGDDCATYIETSNTNPVVTLPYTDGFSIPIETPIILEGSAFDAEDDPLTYSWEEFDLGPLATPAVPVGDSPQFISEVPNETPERYLPELSKVRTNIFDKLEVMPFYDKDFTFRLTARDNNDEAGGSHWEEVQFFSTENAGPFRVEYPSITGSFQAGAELTVTWDVSNTDQAPVNCQFVSIYLSTDGGFTYPDILASFVPNDGSQEVVIPDVVTTSARVMVRAADNIFYDISNLNSTITPATEPGFSGLAIPGYAQICSPDETSILINTNKILDFNEEIELEVIGTLPDDVGFTFTDNTIDPGGSTNLIVNTENITESGIYTIQMRGIAGTDTAYFSTILDLKSSDYSQLQTISPSPGQSGLPPVPTFTWAEDDDADSYIFELSEDPAFEEGVILVYEDDIIGTTYTHDEPLFKNTVYFWRVSGVNRCGAGFTTEISAFATEALSCKEYEENEVPVNIPSGAASTTLLETVIVSNGQVSDINVRNLKGTHTNFKDLKVTLVSPIGTEALLWDQRCLGATSFNVGFDSDSPNEISCPMLNGAIYKPEGDLSVFNGEELLGTWTLRVEDLVSTNGGKVNAYIFDICSNASLSAPSLVKNVNLFVVPGGQDLINQGRLLAQDDDNDADELIYTLTKVPAKGWVRLNAFNMSVGDKFTQDDLNNNRIAYLHDGVSQATDSDLFTFVVDDGEGGWIDQTDYIINIDVANSANGTPFIYPVNIYPNPTESMIYIEVQNLDNKSYELEIIDVLGRNIYTETKTNSTGIAYNMENLSDGTYFFKITVEDASNVYKVQLQK